MERDSPNLEPLDPSPCSDGAGAELQSRKEKGEEQPRRGARPFLGLSTVEKGRAGCSLHSPVMFLWRHQLNHKPPQIGGCWPQPAACWVLPRLPPPSSPFLPWFCTGAGTSLSRNPPSLLCLVARLPCPPWRPASRSGSARWSPCRGSLSGAGGPRQMPGRQQGFGGWDRGSIHRGWA